MRKFIYCFLFLLFSSPLFANNADSVEFFTSNNTAEIDVQTAYHRLTGKEQINLKNEVINVMKKNHIEKGNFESILGTYRMSSDKHITADNTEEFIISSSQAPPNKKIFFVAQELANDLKQESTAVFVLDNNSTISDVNLEFVSYQPTINETFAMLREKLPAVYSEAFSLHLSNEYAGFNSSRVAKVEWLGSKIKIDDIKKSFPHEKVSYHYGKAFLVYKDDHRAQL